MFAECHRNPFLCLEGISGIGFGRSNFDEHVRAVILESQRRDFRRLDLYAPTGLDGIQEELGDGDSHDDSRKRRGGRR
jgi:hypothetical protein